MAGPLSHMWYVKAAGRVWGPYPDTRVAAFAREGRVSATTPMSPFPAGPFTPAASHPEFAPLLLALAEAAIEAAARPAEEAPGPTSLPPSAALPPARAPAAPIATTPVAAAPPAALPTDQAPAPSVATAAPGVAPAARPAELSDGGPLRTLLVWAELSGETLRAFPSALAAFGPGVAVRPGLWLVQAHMAPSAVRNLLSRRLGPSDSLLVVEAGLEQAAWFNLEPGRDRELRHLWGHARKA